MDIDRKTLDWNHLRAFLATAESGSLSGAARELGQTQPTLGRQITALEDSLGVILFERVNRGLVMTDAGQDLLTHARQMGEAADRAALAASGLATEIKGKVTISASDVFAQYLLPDIIARILGAAPQLDIEIVAANEISNLMKREADIAIRHVRPEQPELIARSLGEATAHLFGARSYLRARGTPQTIADLAAHDFIGMGNIDEVLGFYERFGLPVGRENIHVATSNGNVGWALVQRGLGLLVMADQVGRATPEVTSVLEDQIVVPFPVWLVTHRELHTSPRIRLVFDLLAEELKKL